MSAQPGDAVLLHYAPRPAAVQPGGALLLDYNPKVVPEPRTLRGGVAALWSDTHTRDEPQAHGYGITQWQDYAHAAPWTLAAALRDAARAEWGITGQRDAGAAVPWGLSGLHDAQHARAAWGITGQRDADATPLPWGAPGWHDAQSAAARYGATRPADTAARPLPWGLPAPGAPAWLVVTYGITRRTDADRRYPWSYGASRDAGTAIEIGDGEPPTDEHGTIIIPVRRIYFVLNEAYLVRLSDGEPIPASDVAIGIDVDSWAWSFSATLAPSAWPLVTGAEPVAVRTTVNGYPFDAIIERVDRVRRFGQHQLRATGRSRHAALAAPYSAATPRTNAEARTAQQLADEALAFTGYTLDWAIPDWLVPAGTWSHQGTPIEAVATIAAAAGGYAQGDPTLDVLHVLPRYPALPWEWAAATPDVQLPLAVLIEESLETVEKPAFNAVYVAGTTQGIIGHIKRAGSAGDVLASLITDPLITHVDAARARGGAVLADTGRQQRITLSLPISADVPLLLPGKLVEVLDTTSYRALTRTLNLSAAWNDTGLIVRQSVGLERHLEV